jgi:hypothetical protein
MQTTENAISSGNMDYVSEELKAFKIYFISK